METLIVFADDWGRHPSSAQHLVRHLLPRYRVIWVNTLGTRRPRLAWGDLRKIAGRLGRWMLPRRKTGELPENLTVIAPRMWPGFRTPRQRRFNARQLTKAVERAMSAASRPVSGRSPRNPRSPGTGPARAGSLQADVTVLTTLPITADLVEMIPGRWVYYCVDDFSTWPGADHAVMDAMERELVGKVDAVVCVSEVLRQRVKTIKTELNRGGAEDAEEGKQEISLLTHGVDLEMWRRPTVVDDPDPEPRPLPKTCEHIFHAMRHSDWINFAFWGLLDERLDVEWLQALTQVNEQWTFLVGPGTITLSESCRVIEPGPLPHDKLPLVAAAADVLIMPYIDAPVTRAMQPLKLLEYLATYKPVVVRDLPATRAWADCCDVVSSAEEFVRVCWERAETGLPESQRAARARRLPGESWADKAAALEAILGKAEGGSEKVEVGSRKSEGTET